MPEKLKRFLVKMLAAFLAGAVGLGLTYYLVKAPVYGAVLFWAVPLLMGFIATAVNRVNGRQEFWPLTWAACIAFFFYGLGILVFLLDGIICMVMAAPVAFPFVMLGTYLGRWALHDDRDLNPVPIVILIAVLAACIAADVFQAESKSVNEARTTIDIIAPPSVVWNEIVRMDKLPPTADWVLNTGLACPVRCQINAPRVGGVRQCVLTTGLMPERITSWEPGRRLGFVSLSTPPPMKEINPFGETEAAHLHGYYRVLYAEFTLEPLPNGGTHLTRLTRYENKVRPFFYWDAICNFGLQHGHQYVLEYLKHASEVYATKSRLASNN